MALYKLMTGEECLRSEIFMGVAEGRDGATTLVDGPGEAAANGGRGRKLGAVESRLPVGAAVQRPGTW